ncbi:hypothetical protein MKZ38_007334 [Zalerion maritima]|uniref:Golgi apparatus membrane protein TVP38 n=1 Tax=Zalerion maritima TaxID=339359 RepID=A0AAD5RUW1_9PEZI|nr:hypothetical protein MKZ38_007334 [Zalerion maritima]
MPQSPSLPDPESFASLASPEQASRTPSAPDTSSAPWVRRSHPRSHSSRRLRNPYSLARTSSGRSSLIASAKDPRAIIGRAIRAGNKILTNTGRAFLALSIPQRIAVGALALVAAVLSAAFLAYSDKIFVWLRPAADKWRNMAGGWILVFLAGVATAFPPLIGYSTVVMISGFLYGFPGGWPVVAAANVVGSTLSLILCRTVFSDYVHRVVGEDKRFVALGQVMRRDGLGMLTMIRVCPLPYSISNGFLAQVPSIKPWAFGLATGLSSPKLLVHVFIGSRLALLADEGDTMSTGDKVVNYISMGIGGIVGLTVGWLVYRRTMARAAELAAEEQSEAGDYAADLLREAGIDVDEEADLESGALGVDDDDISLWDTDTYDGQNSYRDDMPEEVEMVNGISPKVMTEAEMIKQ